MSNALQSVRVRFREPADDVLLRRNRTVLPATLRPRTSGQTLDFGIVVRAAEEGHGLAGGDERLRDAKSSLRRRNDAVQSGAQDVVAPACEEVAGIHDDCARLTVGER